MTKVILDTETTGIKPGHIIQLAYLVLSPDNRVEKARNYYFMVDYISPGAVNVHGITKDKLKVLSDGNRFKHHIEEIYQDLSGRLIIAQNASFDIRFLRKEFRDHGLDLAAAHTFCTMKYMTDIMKLPKRGGGQYKWPNQEEILTYLRIDQGDIRALSKKFFGVQQVKGHDARFDTAGVYCIYDYIEKQRKPLNKDVGKI